MFELIEPQNYRYTVHKISSGLIIVFLKNEKLYLKFYKIA